MAVIRDNMPAFELFQPETTAAALSVLERYGSEAWVLAGGLDTWDWLKDRVRRPVAEEKAIFQAVEKIERARRPLLLRSVLPAGSTLFCEVAAPGRFGRIVRKGGGWLRVGRRTEWGFGLAAAGAWPNQMET